MPKRSFMLNYGGPGGIWWTSTQDKIPKLDEVCKDCYGPPTRTESFFAHGLEIKVLTYGIHRGLYVELPEDAGFEAEHLYEELSTKARDFCKKGYNLLGNNCVTSVATVLHALDPNITPQHIVFPWTLDAIIKKHQYLQTKEADLRPFFEVYQKKLEQSTYLPFRNTRLKLQEIKSSKEIIMNAHSQDKTQRERTKSSLLELNWVIEDNHGMLHPTKNAPPDFSRGLKNFNHETRKVKVLEILYNEEKKNAASVTKKNIFADNPDYETALIRMQKKGDKLPDHALERILLKMDAWLAQQDVEKNSVTSDETSSIADDEILYFDDDDIYGFEDDEDGYTPRPVP